MTPTFTLPPPQTPVLGGGQPTLQPTSQFFLYDYDSLYRLTGGYNAINGGQANGGQTYQYDYTYDLNGNRCQTSVTLNDTTIYSAFFAYNDANQLMAHQPTSISCQFAAAGVPQNFTYDLEGKRQAYHSGMGRTTTYSY